MNALLTGKFKGTSLGHDEIDAITHPHKQEVVGTTHQKYCQNLVLDSIKTNKKSCVEIILTNKICSEPGTCLFDQGLVLLSNFDPYSSASCPSTFQSIK